MKFRILLSSIAALVSRVVLLANQAPAAPLVGEAVELSNLAETGDAPVWLEIPFGNFDHKQGVQVVDRASADAMLANLAELKKKKGSKFVGIPIYLNHPDVPAFANQSPDKKAKGWITEAEATADGLRLKADLNAPGKELLANKEVRFFSPVWKAEAVAGRTKAYRPVQLVSIGLTNDPQIDSCQLPNETGGDGPGMPPWLTKGLGLADGASEDDHKTAFAAKMDQAQKAGDLADAHAKVQEKQAEAQKANDKLGKAHDALQKAHQALTGTMANGAAGEIDALLTHDFGANPLFTAERKARAEVLVANAITAGKITLAEKEGALATLANAGADFDTKAAELANRKAALKTGSWHTARLGDQKEASERGTAVLDLVNQRMDEKREDYDTAFAAVKKANPGLFAAMTQPGQA
jgi:hypothetical protein